MRSRSRAPRPSVPAVIAFAGGFHGRTFMTMALTGKVDPYKKGFGPLPGDIYHVPFPNRLHGIELEQSLQALQFLFKADVEPGRVAAILIEPVQGEGGFYIAPFELLRELRRICDEHGILLIVDEVQTGFGRTGKMFALEHSGIKADLVTMAKSLAAGVPLAAVVGRAAVMDAVGPGGLGGTYGGNPIACAAGLAVLKVFEEEQLLERSVKIGEHIMQSNERIGGDQSLLLHRRSARTRRHGGNRAGRGPALPINPQLHSPSVGRRRCARNGLIMLTCGVYGNVARILVPLTASDAVIDEGLSIMEGSLDEALGTTA